MTAPEIKAHDERIALYHCLRANREIKLAAEAVTRLTTKGMDPAVCKAMNEFCDYLTEKNEDHLRDSILRLKEALAR